MKVARSGPNAQVERRNRFEIVIEHIRSSIDHRLDRAVLAQKVWGQDFDCRTGRRLLNASDDSGKVSSTAVGQIVAVDGCHNDML